MRSHATLSKLVVGLIGALGIISVASAADVAKPELTGKQLAYDRSMGNCLACHAMPTQTDAESPGTIGPPLIAMKARYPDKAKLRAQIWNSLDTNPNTAMPPFGKNKILTEAEIDRVTDFIYGL
ncbi:MAG: sulfur oxidation c-type cytochrome SoxX [Sulfuriferula sp.]|nr:sulfur oxidation c-type cytochrome SoxX [Sulfuriferula sp.]